MSDTKTEKWLFPIEGHNFDLEDLPYWLMQCDVQASIQKDDYFLEILLMRLNITLYKQRK